MDLGIVTKKIGPLPVWAYAAVGVVGMYAVHYFRGGKSATPVSAPALSGAGQGFAPIAYPGSGASTTPTEQTVTAPDFGPPPGFWDSIAKQFQDLAQTNPGNQTGPAGQASSPIATLPATIPALPTVAGLTPIPGLNFTGVVQNPAGYTQSQADTNPGYTPSALDRATEQPGGLQYTQIQVGSSPGQTATVYKTATGSGPVVPSAKRIVGERYDAYGRVIA